MTPMDRFLPRIEKLPANLRLRPGFTLVAETPKQFLFSSGTQNFEISLPFPGIALLDFFNQLSGEQTLLEILAAMPPFHINFLLDVAETLYRSGLLVPTLKESNGVNPRYAASANLFDQFRPTMPGESVKPFLLERTWQERLSSARVGLVGLGRVGSQLARLLAIAGVHHMTAVADGHVDKKLLVTDAWYFPGDQGKQRGQALAQNLHELSPNLHFRALAASVADLENGAFPADLLEMDVVVVATDELRPKLYESVNQVCVEAGIPWTSYRPSWHGLSVEVGPTVLPRETACYDCYQHRQQSNLADPDRHQALQRALSQQAPPLLDIQITPCVSLLCYEILRLLSQEVPPLTLTAVMEFTLTTAELVRHPLLKVPRCPTCRRDIRPFAPVRFWSELATPDTLENIAPAQPALQPTDLEAEGVTR